MDKGVVVQKVNITSLDSFDRALKYYNIILSVNNIFLPPMEMNLLAFTAIRGTISSGGAKEKFIEIFPTATKASIGNTIYKLTKKNLFVKINKKVVVNPSISINFNFPLLLQIKLNGKAD